MTRGKFITFEGIDGAGKTTQIQALQRFLTDRGIEVVRTREPGGTPLGEKIRALLLNDDMNLMAETLLFFAARSQHITDVIVPALQRGAWVLSDRFTDATYAYQVGGKGFEAQKVLALEAIVQEGFGPDKTVVFDLDPAIAAKRLATTREPDRFEKENRDFFTRVRNAYLDRAQADPKRFLTLDASLAPEAITQELLSEAQGWL